MGAPGDKSMTVSYEIVLFPSLGSWFLADRFWFSTLEWRFVCEPCCDGADATLFLAEETWEL